LIDKIVKQRWISFKTSFLTGAGFFIGQGDYLKRPISAEFYVDWIDHHIIHVETKTNLDPLGFPGTSSDYRQRALLLGYDTRDGVVIFEKHGKLYYGFLFFG